MALDFRSMTFATVVSLYLQRDFAQSYTSPYIWTASPMHQPHRKQPLMLPAPTPKKEEEAQKKPRVKSPREPDKYDIVIYNTDRMPPDYIRGMLIRIFREEAGDALVKSYFHRHIHEGPYTRDVAQTKAQQVRSDAFENEVPIPELRYVRR